MKLFSKYYGLRGMPLNIAIGVLAGLDFLLCKSTLVTINPK